MATVGDRTVGDVRTFEESDYFLPNEFVNKFEGEVKSRPSADEGDAEEPDIADTGAGDPTDGLPEGTSTQPCASNWKAAAGAERKRMWAVFDESGVFASACRHGLILWIADMIRCGELYVAITRRNSLWSERHYPGQSFL
jgi:hypothetical protein